MLGLGVLGRGVNVAKFLAKKGAILIITDKKTAEQLAPAIKQLKAFKNIKYVFGEHNLSDFQNADMVIKAASVPLDSLYIAEARKNNIPVEMDASLFVKLNLATIIGITGTRGKSTVTQLIYEIIQNYLVAKPPSKKKKVFLGGNVKGLATLPLLNKVKSGDIVVMELDSWQLQGFGDSKISPHISVFTNLMCDHQNYYKNSMKQYFEDKTNIFKYQKNGDILVIGKRFLPDLKKFGLSEIFADLKKNTESKIITAKTDKKIKTKLLGSHNKENIALAVKACQQLGINEKIIKKTVADFRGIPGRLEFIGEKKGIKYYNDTTATTPDGVIAALKALQNHLAIRRPGESQENKIILIGGGTDKELDYTEYVKLVLKYIKTLILFKGTASEKIKKVLSNQSAIISTRKKEKQKINIISNITSMKDAVAEAQKFTKKGDIVLLSPGAASFGVFKNEFDRGEQFNKIVKKLR